MNNNYYTEKIHDRTVRPLLRQHANLVSILAAVLAVETLRRIDLSQVRPVSEALRSVDGKELQADVVCELPLLNGGRWFAVIEHKSRRDADTLEQLYGYVAAIEREYTARDGVIPILFYHGKGAWPAQPEAISPELRPFEPLVIDIRAGGLDSVALPSVMRALVEILKVGRRVADAAVLVEIAQRYMRPLYEKDRDGFELLVRYILSIAERARGLTREAVLRILEEHIEKEVSTMGKSFLQEAWDEGEQAGITTGIAEGKRVGIATGMAVGKRVGIAEGKQAGLDKGRVEGHVEGKVEGHVEVAQRLVQMGFGSDTVHKATGLSSAEIDALRRSLNGSQR